MRPSPTKKLFSGALCSLAACLALVSAGCNEAPTTPNKPRAQLAAQRQANQSAALLESAIGRLRTLPEAIDTQLQPPSVVLDKRSSTNGGELLAIIGFTPGDEASGLNLLTVRSENAGFAQAGIQAGDIVKCYLVPDRESRERLQETGDLAGAVLSHEAVELTVGQVLGPNTLRLSDGLRIPLRIAKELTTDLDRNTIAALEARGIINADGVLLPPETLQQLPGVPWPFNVEVWRVRDDRMRDVETNMKKYAVKGEPAFGWEPSADQAELEQLVQRINQWTRGRQLPDDWSPANLYETLDAKLRDKPELADYASPDALRRKTFVDYEARLIQEAIWLRDVSRWASGDKFDPLDRASQLFDWVVRNITLSTDPRVIANRPWQTLLAGRGGATQRAWVFAGLCRQQKIPVAIVEVPQTEGAPWLWCGVLVEGKLHLFDPQLGLPIPSSDAIATLSEVKSNSELLRGLDLPDSPYPVTAEQLAEASLNVAAEPLALAWRAAELETQLKGDDSLVLSVDADALAAKLNELGAGQPKLWSAPYEYYRRRLAFGPNNRNAQRIAFLPYAWRPVLWRARVLHFRGLFETEEEARKIAQRAGDALYDAVNDHRRATQDYTDRSVRPSDKRLVAVPEDKRRIYQRAKIDATYWLGLLNYEQGSYKSARRWLTNKTLDLPAADFRDAGVRYNLARVYEASGDKTQAATLLEADDSPQQHGNRLRARRLRGEGGDQQTPADQEAATEDGA